MTTAEANAALSLQPGPELQYHLEQFYFREARYLDNRQLQQWMTLLTEDMIYDMPVRHTPVRNAELRGTEAYLNVEDELSGGLAPPHREENYFTIALRVDRAFKTNSWSDNPPARTRRFITNIEALPGDAPNELRVFSNFLCTYSRHQQDNVTYSGQREDILRQDQGTLKIARRRVIIDWNVITAPSLGLYF